MLMLWSYLNISLFQGLV